MEFEIWHYWIIAAIVFMMLEIFVPSFLMASIGIGCFFAFFGALFDIPLAFQLVLFIIGTLIGILGVKPFMVNYGYKTQCEVRTNVHGMVGRIGKVCDTIDPEKKCGHVVIDGDVWQAVAADDILIPAGSKVEVVVIDSIVLTVKPVKRVTSDNKNQENNTPSKGPTTEMHNPKLMVSIGNKQELIDMSEVLCFYSSQKMTYLLMHSGRNVIIDDSLDKLHYKLSDELFFRANRQFIISIGCIREIISEKNGKLRIKLCTNKHLPETISVSRLKSHAFRKWMKCHCT